MKKIYFGLMAMCLAFACAKEPAVQDVIDNKPEEGELVSYSFNVAIAPVTKAYIDEGGDDKGVLKWDADDEIAVYNAATEEYVVFTTSGTGAKATFTGLAPTGANFTKAYYPSDYRGETVADYLAGKYASTENMSVSGSQKCIPMEIAEITAGDTELTFAHKASIIKFRISNVPSFTRKATLWYGELQEDIQISEADASTGEVEVYFSVPAYNGMTIAIDLYDSSNNQIFYKQATNKDIAFSNLYRYHVTIGHVIRVIDEVSWSNRYLALWDSNSNYTLFDGNNSFPWKFNELSAHDHYVVIPAALTWASEGAAVAVRFQNTTDNPTEGNETHTDLVYLTRNITFNVPEELGMKTEYRIYPRSSTRSSLNMYVTKPLSFYIKNTANWNEVSVYLWGTKGDNKVEPWGTYDERKTDHWISARGEESLIVGGNTYTNLKRYDLPASLLGSDASDSGLIIGNLTNSDKSGDLKTSFLGDILVDFNTASSSILGTNFDNRLSEAWPGTPFTGITSAIQGDKYFSFNADDYYGSYVWVVFSENGSSQSDTWYPLINRDYDYGY